MTGDVVDLGFPDCCAHCPHIERLTASCTHELRQSLVGELVTGRTCPVYRQEKTDAMRRLVDSGEH